MLWSNNMLCACSNTRTCIQYLAWEMIDLHKSKQANTTNLGITLHAYTQQHVHMYCIHTPVEQTQFYCRQTTLIVDVSHYSQYLKQHTRALAAKHVSSKLKTLHKPHRNTYSQPQQTYTAHRTRSVHVKNDCDSYV